MEGKFQKQKDFDPVFPLKYNAQQNIYILTENSFANKLVQLCIDNKTQKLQNQKSLWYLHPQEALYLISVWQYKQEEQKQYRQRFIMQIYKRCHTQDIEMMHFYLNIRKRNKFGKRVDKFSYERYALKHQIKNEQSQIGKTQQLQEFILKNRLLKIYETHEDYKHDQNFTFYLITKTKQTILSKLFNPELQKIKKLLNVSHFNLCIIENNDFIVTQVSQF